MSEQSRRMLNRRTITCEGYVREDGLLDIEGCLVDVLGKDTTNSWRGTVQAGEPVHQMRIRLTVDESLKICALEEATDAAPYPPCRSVALAMQTLVGLRIVRGFRQEVRRRIGGPAGCTHVLSLLDSMASAAVQTLGNLRKGVKPGSGLAAIATLDPNRPTLIDSCVSFAAASPIVAVLWPAEYRPNIADAGSGPVNREDSGTPP